MRCTALALMLAGSLAQAGEAEDDVRARLLVARVDAQVFPDDYAAQLALGRAAAAAGEHPEALGAFAQAEALSGGNLELSMARIPSAVARADWRTARRDARAVRASGTELPAAWMLRAWARRFDPSRPGAGPIDAAAAYRRAVRLAPETREAWCGLAHVRAARGDVLGAHAALSRATTVACPEGGIEDHDGGLVAWGTMLAAAQVWTDHPTYSAGGSGMVDVGLTYERLLTVGGNFRLLGLDSPFVDAGLLQLEGWGRVAVHHAGHGAMLVAGGTSTRSESTTRAGFESVPMTASSTVGGRFWTTWWLTVSAGAAWSSYADGTVWQADVDVQVPVLPWLTPFAGVGLTVFDGAVTADAAPGTRVAGRAGVRFDSRDVTATLGARFGPEMRPFRFDTLSLYNVSDLLAGSGWAGLTWRAVAGVDVHLGYEVLRLRAASDPSALRWQHVVTAGITLKTDRPHRRSPP